MFIAHNRLLFHLFLDLFIFLFVLCCCRVKRSCWALRIFNKLKKEVNNQRNYTTTAILMHLTSLWKKITDMETNIFISFIRNASKLTIAHMAFWKHINTGIYFLLAITTIRFVYFISVVYKALNKKKENVCVRWYFDL